jgi:hypothetical protein
MAGTAGHEAHCWIEVGGTLDMRGSMVASQAAEDAPTPVATELPRVCAPDNPSAEKAAVLPEWLPCRMYDECERACQAHRQSRLMYHAYGQCCGVSQCRRTHAGPDVCAACWGAHCKHAGGASCFAATPARGSAEEQQGAREHRGEQHSPTDSHQNADSRHGTLLSGGWQLQRRCSHTEVACSASTGGVGARVRRPCKLDRVRRHGCHGQLCVQRVHSPDQLLAFTCHARRLAHLLRMHARMSRSHTSCACM